MSDATDMTGLTDEQRETWTEQEREEFRIDELCSPLFQMLLEFETTFANKAIDELDVSDTDAEAMALRMDGDGRLGSAYAYLLRHISHERIMRGIHHKVSAIWAAKGRSESIALVDVNDEYAKLNRGDA